MVRPHPGTEPHTVPIPDGLVDHPVCCIGGSTSHTLGLARHAGLTCLPLSVMPKDSYRRVSSHFSMVPSYGVPEGSVLRTLLTGRTLKGDSWFQFEAAGWAPLSQPLESLMHAFNFLQYRVSGYQVRTRCMPGIGGLLRRLDRT